MSCNKTETGISVNEPYRMQDARTFTDYRSSNELDREVRQVLEKNGCSAKSTYDYKLCLTRNADILIKHFNTKPLKKMEFIIVINYLLKIKNIDIIYNELL
jgi:hypothetical protein